MTARAAVCDSPKDLHATHHWSDILHRSLMIKSCYNYVSNRGSPSSWQTCREKEGSRPFIPHNRARTLLLLLCALDSFRSAVAGSGLLCCAAKRGWQRTGITLKDLPLSLHRERQLCKVLRGQGAACCGPLHA